MPRLASEFEEMMKRLLRSEVSRLETEVRSLMKEQREAREETKDGIEDLKQCTKIVEVNVKDLREHIDTILPAMFLALMAQSDDKTPSLFVLQRQVGKKWHEKLELFSEEFQMQFLCEYHDGAHRVTTKHDRNVEFISLKLMPEKVKKALVHIRPYFKRLKPFLSLGASALSFAQPEVSSAIGIFEKLLQEFDKKINEADRQDDIQGVELTKENNAQASSDAQRALNILLEGVQHREKAWKYLEKRIHRGENRPRWLCLEHRKDPKKEYASTEKELKIAPSNDLGGGGQGSGTTSNQKAKKKTAAATKKTKPFSTRDSFAEDKSTGMNHVPM